MNRTIVAMLVQAAALLGAVAICPQVVRAERPESIRITEDGRGFCLARSGRSFTPWGFNYPAGDKLIEDYWERDWSQVETDFREMKALGANVIRIHLQVGKFLTAADKPNDAALHQLKRLIDLAEQDGVYLDLTGLACYRKADVPAWYDALVEKDRWAAQATFWQAVAGVTADRPGVFCLDLMNEPLSPGDKRGPEQWYSGKPFGGLDFLQFIAIDPAGRSRSQIVHDWIAMLTTAIRQKDSKHPITVGLLPWVEGWGYLSGFAPAEVGPQLDFVAVHIYPDIGKVDRAMETVRRFSVGKPLLIEETFPLSCSAEELKAFIRESRPVAAGWLGHYEGQTLESLREAQSRNKLTPSEAILLSWLDLFKSMSQEINIKSP